MHKNINKYAKEKKQRRYELSVLMYSKYSAVFLKQCVALIYHVQCVLSALWLLRACDIQGLMDNFQPALINSCVPTSYTDGKYFTIRRGPLFLTLASVCGVFYGVEMIIFVQMFKSKCLFMLHLYTQVHHCLVG